MTLIRNYVDDNGSSVFLYFSKKDRGEKGSEYKKYDINKLMSNIGGESYEYDSFKTLHDSNPIIQNMVDDYDEKGITIEGSKDFDSDESEDNDSEDKKDVGDNNRKRITQAAKRAAKKATKKKI